MYTSWHVHRLLLTYDSRRMMPEGWADALRRLYDSMGRESYYYWKSPTEPSEAQRAETNVAFGHAEAAASAMRTTLGRPIGPTAGRRHLVAQGLMQVAVLALIMRDRLTVDDLRTLTMPVTSIQYA